ncbi:hypothetical protein M8C13_16055 [Crossiella sp. SN42]|uniref:hypothetical protein n=1 Tax=Crossiella sp. SN42 TaxID=2944808 RepID=UPI00207CCDDC|nr:hypothetical protein [Crossiella sp. SN42]MCO1577270.1 hypothetical protein [Crossiella sp. SN42]
MELFACAGCDTPLTTAVTRVALPGHTHQVWGTDGAFTALLDAGTYVVDPEPSGPPWRPLAEVGAAEAAALGVFAPVHSLSFGAPGAIGLAPGDTRNTVLVPSPCRGACCGQDGGDGPNLVCAGCRRPVATRVDDCERWQVVWLVPDAVRRLPATGPAEPPADWPALLRDRGGIPPVEPSGMWDQRWEAELGVTLAHLLAACEGAAVTVPEGLLADTLGRVLTVLLPPGPPEKTLALAGPGLPAPDADLVLVPRHPQTGEIWSPPGAAAPVPVAADVWIHLAFQQNRPLVPTVKGDLPEAESPRLPWSFFLPDTRVFLRTLARLPAVREPWLRAIYDRVSGVPCWRPW